ncbi:MAG: hypothetical protein ACM3ZT_08305 [Bacillota bacterium]
MNFNLDLNHLGGTLLFSGFILFFLYRRFRRNFGRQKLSRWRLKLRMWVLGVLGMILLPFAFFSAERAIATVLGAGIGVALGMWAAKHTRFLKQDGKLYYIPHTYTGIAVSALFIGRLIYRFVVVAPSVLSVATMASQGANPADFGGWQAISHNPVTRTIFFILIGYYLYYYGYVLHESEHLKPEDWEQPESAKPNVGGNLPEKKSG